MSHNPLPLPLPLTDPHISPDSSTPPPSTHRKRLVQKLLRGHESAAHLQILLRSPSAADRRSVSAVAAQVSRSFTEALSILDSLELSGESLCSDLDSGDSRSSPVFKDRRTSHKKRKVSKTRIVVSPAVEDGHGWRKYGQKAILNAKHPRCYFRCTHKYDQGCEATKQVQRTEQDSDLFRITYIGDHTCTLPPPIIHTVRSHHPLSSSYISFSASPTSTHPLHWLSKEDTTTSGLTDNLSSFDETELWSELTGFDKLPASDCEYGDAISNDQMGEVDGSFSLEEMEKMFP